MFDKTNNIIQSENIDNMVYDGIGFDGIRYIQQTGQKVQGKIYLDKTQPGLWYCLKTTSAINNTSDFTRADSTALLDKLQNLLSFETVEIANFVLPISGSIIVDLKESWTNFVFLKLAMLDNNREWHVDTVFLPVKSLKPGDGFYFSDPGNVSSNINGTSHLSQVVIRDYGSITCTYGGTGADANNRFIVEGICRIS